MKSLLSIYGCDVLDNNIRILKPAEFGFAVHLTSQFERSFSNHSYGYSFSNDRPNCFDSYSAITESSIKHPNMEKYHV